MVFVTLYNVSINLCQLSEILIIKWLIKHSKSFSEMFCLSKKLVIVPNIVLPGVS